MTILGIILIIIGVAGFISGILLEFCMDSNVPYIFLCFLVFLTPIGSKLITIEPTKQDVLDGKAIYQESQIITGNDTIKTYDIIWKQKNY